MDGCLSESSDFHGFKMLQSELAQFLQRREITLHKWFTYKAQPSEPQVYPLDRHSKEITIKTSGMM